MDDFARLEAALALSSTIGFLYQLRSYKKSRLNSRTYNSTKA
jgi:hypothetical protein